MMEDNRRDPSSDFDSEYIDQLFSAGRTPTNQDPISAASPAEQEPEPETVPESAKPKGKHCLLILAAVGLLLLGFLAGTLATREKQPENVTTPPATISATTLPPQFGFIPNYESWSTDSLVVAATELPIFWDVPVTQENFMALSSQFQVLDVLYMRNDARDALQKILKSAQPDENAYAAAQWLMTYLENHVFYLPPCKWLQNEDSHFAVYEFTVAPNFLGTASQNGATMTVLEFYGNLVAVEGDPEILRKECNFWFLLEKKEGSNAELDADQFRIYNSETFEEVSKVLMDFLPCEQGWLICGYAPFNISITLNYNTLSNGSISFSTALPLPEDLPTKEFLQQTLELGAFTRYLLDTKPDNFHYHPLMAALLEREDLISTALQIVENTPQSDPYALMGLLTHESVYDQMTDTQKNALEMLEAKRYWSGYRFYSSRPAMAITGEYAVCDIYYLSAADAKIIRDTEADHWFFFGLSSGAIELNDGSWTLEIEEQGSGSEKANILLWPAYHSRGDYAQVGWLIAVQGEIPYLLRLTIRDGRGNILDAAEVTWADLLSHPEN